MPKNRDYEVNDYMEDHGFDPMGSSDIIGAFMAWVRVYDTGEPVWRMLERFEKSSAWEQFYPKR